VWCGNMLLTSIWTDHIKAPVSTSLFHDDLIDIPNRMLYRMLCQFNLCRFCMGYIIATSALLEANVRSDDASSHHSLKRSDEHGPVAVALP
jgi:hypothetical protein